MRLLTKLLMKGGGGALRFASVLNRRHSTIEAATATRLKLWVRTKVIIGSSDFSSLKVILSGTYHGTSEPSVNDYVVEKMVLEKETGGAAFTPIYFSGSRSVTVPSGTPELLSDAILPSAFGLGSFPRGGVYWVRALLSVSAFQNFPVAPGKVGTTNVALLHNTVTCGVSDVDGTGAPAYTTGTGGTGPSDYAFVNHFHALVVGVPTSSTAKYVAGIGDSIIYGSNDTTAPDSGQFYGFFARSLVNSDFTTNPIAGCNFGVGGGIASYWTTAPVSKMLLKYANVTVEQYGTNTPQYAQSAALWAEAKAQGHYVIRTKLLTKTTSTDAWATTVNQTKDAAWTTPSGDRITFNTAIAAQNGILYDAFIDFDADVLHTDRDLWKAPGYASDSLHPTSLAHELMAAKMRTAYAAIP